MAESTLELVGGIEAVAGMEAPASAPRTFTAGLRQVEGGLRWRAVAFDTRVELDAGVALAPVTVFSLVPEHLSVTASGGKAWLGVGVAPGRWRVEAVDGWDNALVSFTGPRAPVSLLQAELGFGSPELNVRGVGGLDLGAGLDLLAAPLVQLEAAPIVAGIRGEGEAEGFRAGGGWFVYPNGLMHAFEADARVQIEDVGIQGELVVGVGRPSGGAIQVDWAGPVTPALRVGTDGATVDTDLGVRWDPAAWATLKAEVGWDDWAPGYPAGGTLAGWVSAAIYTPEPKRVGKR
jgi:hypothetical protein